MFNILHYAIIVVFKKSCKEDNISSVDNEVIEKALEIIRKSCKVKKNNAKLNTEQQEIVAILYYEHNTPITLIQQYLLTEYQIKISSPALSNGVKRWSRFISEENYNKWCLIRNRPGKNDKKLKKQYVPKKNKSTGNRLKELEEREAILLKKRDDNLISYTERNELLKIQKQLKGNN